MCSTRNVELNIRKESNYMAYLCIDYRNNFAIYLLKGVNKEKNIWPFDTLIVIL